MATERVLIVNADDLGRTAAINRGVIESHRSGIVRSASLMVMPGAVQEAVAATSGHPELGIGLHLQLTRGAPLLAPERIPGLVDGDGRLPARPEDLDSAPVAEVAAEIRAQLDRFQELTGRLPTHLDGHHHCHGRPPVFEAVLQLAQEHRLPVRSLDAEMRARLRRHGLDTPDSFDDRFFGNGVRREVLTEILAGLAPGVTELMCHPGYADDEPLRADSSYVEPRERELALLSDGEILRQVKARGIRLAHFGTAWSS